MQPFPARVATFLSVTCLGTAFVLACTSSTPTPTPQCTTNAECDEILKRAPGTTYCASGVCQMKTVASTPDAGATPDANVDPDSAVLTDAATDAPVVTPQEKAYCDAIVSHGSCPDQVPRACSTEEHCIAAQMTVTAANAFAQCHASPSCKGQDSCLAAAGEAEGGAAATKFASDCLARFDSCEGAFKDDNCTAAAYAFPGVGPAAAACLAQDCAQIELCISAAGKKIIACK